jgi:hypothetical protein
MKIKKDSYIRLPRSGCPFFDILNPERRFLRHAHKRLQLKFSGSAPARLYQTGFYTPMGPAIDVHWPVSGNESGGLRRDRRTSSAIQTGENNNEERYQGV